MGQCGCPRGRILVDASGDEKVAELAVCHEVLHFVIAAARSFFGEVRDALQSGAQSSADLVNVGDRLCVHLHHEKTSVCDEFGVGPAHRVQDCLRGSVRGVVCSVFESSEDLVEAGFEGSYEQALFAGEELEYIGRRDLRGMGDLGDCCSVEPTS